MLVLPRPVGGRAEYKLSFYQNLRKLIQYLINFFWGGNGVQNAVESNSGA